MEDFNFLRILLDLAIIPIVVWAMMIRSDMHEMKRLIAAEGEKLSDEHQIHDNVLQAEVSKLSDRVVDIHCDVKCMKEDMMIAKMKEK